MARALSLEVERWPVDGAFTISRGSKTQAEVVVATITQGEKHGRGECVPYGRYGESVGSVQAQIETIRNHIERGASPEALMALLPAGAARNAVDCALWDLAAKTSGKRAWSLLGVPEPRPIVTAQTISVGSPDTMASQARSLNSLPLLKVKLAGAGDGERIAAVRAASPDARLIVDANEAWSPAEYDNLVQACRAARVELIEQPFPAQDVGAMVGLARPIPVCADESAHHRENLRELRPIFDAVNVKLDKTGGLTEAVAMIQEAREQGFGVMLGCMLATSLSMAQAMVIAPLADWVDLDGPLLLARDRKPGLIYAGGLVHPPAPELYG